MATGGLSGRDEAAQDNLLSMAISGGVGMENSSSSDQPYFHKESQQPQMALPEGRGQSQTATQAYEAGPLELLLDELLEEDQVEGGRPFPVDLDGNSGGKEHEFVQETILQLAVTDCVSKESSSYSDPTNFFRESQLPQWAQPEGQGQEQALTQGCNRGPLELFLDQLLMEVRTSSTENFTLARPPALLQFFSSREIIRFSHAFPAPDKSTRY